MVRIYGESLIFLWDDLLALKMSKIIIWNNTDKHMECGQCLSTAISVFPQCGLVEPHLSPGLWCLAKLTQRGWSHPMMWRSNPSKTSDVSVYVFFFERKCCTIFIKHTCLEGSNLLALSGREDSMTSRGPFQPTFLCICEVACSVLLKI